MTENNILLEELKRTPIEQQRIELVERKGKGHPDSICDAVAEAVSLALCREYLATFGRILHHNTDKGMLVAGRTQPRLGGGQVRRADAPRPGRPGGDGSTTGNASRSGPLPRPASRTGCGRTCGSWTPTRHLVFQNELKEGSPELTDLFEREVIGANDTSAAVGYAPLTETERLVLAAEQWLNSPDFQRRFPEAGEDVKVMGVRRDRDLTLTVALAFVDRFVPDARQLLPPQGGDAAGPHANTSRAGCTPWTGLPFN